MLENLRPQKVFQYFEDISCIPRGSGNTKEISEYCIKFAKDRGLWAVRDKLNNVIIKKPASADCKNQSPVIIQGHLDMVCEKTPESNHDFFKDPLKLVVDGDFVKAENTTLGADDGIAVAMALAILDDDSISHPELEVVFTVDEETGMDGAKNLDMGLLNGRYLLNIDSETDGVITVGCAGGANVTVSFENSVYKYACETLKIHISGLKGGHSGAEIDKERANANILAGRMLYYAVNRLGMGFIDINGGSKDNVITREAVLNLAFINDTVDNAEEKLKEYADRIKKEYAVSDGEIKIEIQREEAGLNTVVSQKNAKDISNFLFLAPYGPQNYVPDMAGLVETSDNLGIVCTDGNVVTCSFSVRSNVRIRKYNLIEKIACLADNFNGKTEIKSDYPEWEYSKNSVLQEIMKKTYKKVYNEELKTEIIHAGLECGFLLNKKPDIDAVSFGPAMYDIHTVNERLSICSTKKTYKWVLAVLEELCK